MNNIPNVPQPQFLNLEYFYIRAVPIIQKIWELFLTILRWLRDPRIAPYSVLLSLFIIAGIIAVMYKTIKIRRGTIANYADFFTREHEPKERYSKWDEIKGHLLTENPIEWRMAVIEADALLDEIMKKIGYKGENLGERLKNIEPSDFVNLQNVWEAHKVRNKIVHEPGKGVFSKKDAEGVIKKYEEALKELKYL